MRMAARPASPQRVVADDRNVIEPGDRVLLIVEDDERFAKILLDQAREKGFRGLIATTGADGMALAGQYKPDAITLDIRLPDMHGLRILDGLKHDPLTRHIPVHVLSIDDERQWSMKLGAVDFLQKPVEADDLGRALARMSDFVERKVKNLLVVEDDETQRASIIELIGNHDVESTGVGTGEAALKMLAKGRFDCMVLDLKLPDMTGFELLGEIKKNSALAKLPVIVYTGKELTKKEEMELRKAAKAIVVKDASSPERLLDETALFLHRVEANLPEEKREAIRQVHRVDPSLTDKTVLVVDDDPRNIYALTTLLERYRVTVLYAENGLDGIETLKKNPTIQAVLMDIMMPDMDGYETMRAIRKISKYKDLPIIALTAKAMKGDREKCIEAGASDYITKPVDEDQLLSLLRVWMYRRG